MSFCRECACRLDDLIGNFARDFENDVEEEKGDVMVEGDLRGGRSGGTNIFEEVGEKCWPLFGVSGKEKKGEGVRELVTQNWFTWISV